MFVVCLCLIYFVCGLFGVLVCFMLLLLRVICGACLFCMVLWLLRVWGCFLGENICVDACVCLFVIVCV